MLCFSGQAFDEPGASGQHLAAEKQAEPASGHPKCEGKRQPETETEESIHEAGSDG